jgi:anti-sigma factor RsiW
MSMRPVTESELHAYVDGALPGARAAEIEAYLAEHAEDAARVAAWREQIVGLHREFDPVLREPLPPWLDLKRGRRMNRIVRFAGVAGGFALGVAVGWQLHQHMAERQEEAASWPRRAAIAHVVYSPEVRHPVEVGADQEAHLVRWLSKRLGEQLKIPHLGEVGYALVGGRLLPGDRGPVAQFMYQDGKGQRLTLYVRVNPDDSRETAFRFAQERGVGVFYWLDRRLGYALSGEIEKAELLRVANAVYRQLNP